MKRITVTELARNLRQVLDRLTTDGEEVVIERNHQQVARLVPNPERQSAREAMADLYRTLPEKAARGWDQGTRGLLDAETLTKGTRDP